MRALVFCAALALPGCARAVPVVSPASDFAACVVADALAGQPLKYIADHCGGDIPAVISAIIGAVVSTPSVAHTGAYAEARAATALKVP